MTIGAAILLHPHKTGIAWKALPIHSKSWADGMVVFNTVSGSTHFLNPVAAKILTLLKECSLSAREISKRIAAENELDPDAEILQQIESVLNTLDNLGLIQSLS